MCRPPEAKSLEQANEVISFLWNKLIELEDRIHTNSCNSSYPPSTDAPGVKRIPMTTRFVYYNPISPYPHVTAAGAV